MFRSVAGMSQTQTSNQTVKRFTEHKGPSENRMHTRKKVNLVGYVYRVDMWGTSSIASSKPVNILDLSSGGARIKIENVRPAEKLFIAIEFNGERSKSIESTVVKIEETATEMSLNGNETRVYSARIKFDDVDRDTKKQLEKYLQSLN